MKDSHCTKDDLRVKRSISSILTKIEISLSLQDRQRNQRHFQSEMELEDYCKNHGLIYFPTKYPL